MESLAGEKDMVQLKLLRVSSSYNIDKQNNKRMKKKPDFYQKPPFLKKLAPYRYQSKRVIFFAARLKIYSTYILRWTTPKATIEFLTPSIIEKNPLHNEALWSEMYQRSLDFGRRGIFLAGLSAIDIALWDIKGKHFGWIFLDFSVANSSFLISKI